VYAGSGTTQSGFRAQDETRIPTNAQVMSGKNLFIGYNPLTIAAPLPTSPNRTFSKVRNRDGALPAKQIVNSSLMIGPIP
jgi:hypothetical protein